MALILGIDTSNYTTSAAIYDTESNTVTQRKKLLPVKDGDCGIRQSDAVFHHVRQLPDVISGLDFDGRLISAVSVSSTPRECEGSYMPCFLSGVATASGIASVSNIPLYTFSHQQGHIAAALFGCDCLNLTNNPFVAFHVSGGTTEALLVTPDEKSIITAELIAKTNDLNAGQLVDRIGVYMGLSFPCGPEIEKLALTSSENIRVKATLKDKNCCLSGFQNKITRIFDETQDKAYTSLYVLKAISSTLIAMTEKIISERGNQPLVFAGGVMSNSIIKADIMSRYPDAYFAPREFSADNAAGVALLGGLVYGRKTDNNE